MLGYRTVNCLITYCQRPSLFGQASVSVATRYLSTACIQVYFEPWATSQSRSVTSIYYRSINRLIADMTTLTYIYRGANRISNFSECPWFRLLSALLKPYNNFKFFLKLHTFCYFQLLCPSVQKHPAHILLPSVNLRGQEAFELRMDRPTWRQ